MVKARNSKVTIIVVISVLVIVEKGDITENEMTRTNHKM